MMEELAVQYYNTRQLPTVYNINGRDITSREVEQVFRYKDGYTVRNVIIETATLYNSKGQLTSTDPNRIDIWV